MIRLSMHDHSPRQPEKWGVTWQWAIPWMFTVILSVLCMCVCMRDVRVCMCTCTYLLCWCLTLNPKSSIQAMIPTEARRHMAMKRPWNQIMYQLEIYCKWAIFWAFFPKICEISCKIASAVAESYNLVVNIVKHDLLQTTNYTRQRWQTTGNSWLYRVGGLFEFYRYTLNIPWTTGSWFCSGYILRIWHTPWTRS